MKKEEREVTFSKYNVTVTVKSNLPSMEPAALCIYDFIIRVPVLSS